MTKLYGIMLYDLWFTAGHVKKCGDDSLTHEPVGRKFLLFEKRANLSSKLEICLRP